MKVILIPSQEVKEVSFGHATNYLIPRGLAIQATETNLQRLTKQQAAKEQQLVQVQAKAKQQANDLAGKEVVLKVKTGKKGKVYGAITKKEIADKLKLLKTQVLLDKPIKKVGSYEVDIKLKGAVTKIKLIVKADSETKGEK